MTRQTTCRLERLIGRETPCPGEPCAFWRTGDGCVIEPATVALAGREDVARLLLGIRDGLETAPDIDGNAGRVALAHSLNKTAQHQLP